MRSVHDFQTNVSCCCNNILEKKIQESLEFCLCLTIWEKSGTDFIDPWGVEAPLFFFFN